MFYWLLTAILLLQQNAPAPEGGGEGGEAAPGMDYSLFIMIGLIVVFFYFFIIRPQQKQAKERDSLLGGLRKRDVVVTSGGLKGRIAGIRENEMTLVIDEKKDVRIRVLKSAVVGIDKREEEDDDEDEEKKDSDSEKK